MKKAVWLTILFLGFHGLASASPVDCTTVLNTNVLSIGSCSLDGLVFSQFMVNSAPTGSSIFLSSVGTGVVGNSIDLGFQIATSTPPSDTLFEYQVSTLNGGVAIMGANNSQNGTAGARIGELVCAVPFVAGICPSASVLANFANPPNTSATFAAQSQVYILKDISLPSSSSFVSSFVNSVEVPEPAISLLTVLGLFGMGRVLRKRSRREHS